MKVVTTLGILILFVMAFLPPIIYVIWIRNTEKFNREKWKPIILCFIWGGTIAVVASLLLEVLFGAVAIVAIENPSIFMLFTVSIIAPFAEELTKPIVLAFDSVKKELVEPEDGLIYGAVAGLGFSATENLFYGANAYLTEGLLFLFALITIRSFAGCLLHASATAWTGYGYGKVIRGKTSILRVVPYLILAIVVHGFYNFIPTVGELTGLSIITIFAMLFVAISIHYVRKKITTLDAANP